MQHIYSLIRSKWLVLLLSLFFHQLSVKAQAPAWQSVEAVTQSSGSYSTVSSLAADANGSIYLTGYFTGTIQFGNITLTSRGLTDVFIAKWNPNGNRFIWAQQAGGPGNDYATAMAVNGSSVYITGSFFSGIAAFGTVVLTNHISNEDVFVAKLSDAGNTSQFVWAQNIGSIESELSSGIVVNGSSVYVVGSFNAASVEFGNIRLASAGGYDIFITKLTDVGNTASFEWAKRAGGLGFDFARALAITGNTLYVTGDFASSTIDFGTTSLTNRGFNSTDVFLVKLTDTGSNALFSAAQQFGGSNKDYANTVAINGDNIYVGGEFYSTAFTIGNISLANVNTSGSTADIFLAKVTDVAGNLNPTWAYRAGGISNDGATMLLTRGTRIYATGYFDSRLATFGNTTLNNAGGDSRTGDIFVAELQDSGTNASFSWAQGAGGSTTDYSFALLSLGNRLYVGGAILSSATFGNQTVNIPFGNAVAYIASLEGTTLNADIPTSLSGVRLYPNPASGAFTVSLPLISGTKEATLLLCDALGRKVRTYTATLSASTSRHTMDLTGLEPGFYTVSVQSGNLQSVLPLIVK